jgi:DNA-binding IscR family transcriptional regulator
MNQTMRQQFSIAKPLDIFVADMLRHVAEKYNAPQCADLRVKVAHCGTREGWMRVERNFTSSVLYRENP